MDGVRVVKGEYDEKESESRALPIVGDCVAEYLKHGNDKKFICFAVSVAHAEEFGHGLDQASFLFADLVAKETKDATRRLGDDKGVAEEVALGPFVTPDGMGVVAFTPK
jgi:hypothetical protein